MTTQLRIIDGVDRPETTYRKNLLSIFVLYVDQYEELFASHA